MVYCGGDTGKEFLYQKITWDDEVIQKLIAIEEAFGTSTSLPDVCLLPDGSKACDELLNAVFPYGKKEKQHFFNWF